MSDVLSAIQAIQARAPGFTPKVGIILGSGLGGLADQVQDAIAIPYSEIPGFPISSVHGHAGTLVLGKLSGTNVAVFKGRVHFYEGHGAGIMSVPVRALKALGAETLMVTNAAGSLRPEVGPGKLMLITDHINMIPGNPLIGANDDAIGPRFLPMAGAYEPDYCERMRSTAKKLSIELAEGTYIAVPGPMFETPAEIRMFAKWGADAVGMSTVPEVILARHCGLKVAAVSAITNLGEGLSDFPLSHDQTLQYAGVAARDLGRLVLAFLEGI
ncbi:purine-nucleoside phosphorylase [Lacibacterium aquatile]|uniref:Purine nucleoside phosphorylase n=1 Tax=Lacibacterium aquatile TaxID=1168082 RepID=A0ABW5DXV3_9PROT